MTRISSYPEPYDLTTVVLLVDGRLLPVWRFDAEAAAWPGAQLHDRWFYDPNADPQTWRQVTEHATAVYGLTKIADTDHGPTDVHTHFGLSYANYLVLHRTLMQSMPEEWQHRMVATLDELHRAFSDVVKAPAYEVTPGADCYVNELDDAQMTAAGVTCETAEGTEDEPGLTTYYDRDFNELDDVTHVIVPLPGGDPVPHYNRGRARVEPELPQLARPLGDPGE